MRKMILLERYKKEINAENGNNIKNNIETVHELDVNDPKLETNLFPKFSSLTQAHNSLFWNNFFF